MLRFHSPSVSARSQPMVLAIIKTIFVRRGRPMVIFANTRDNSPQIKLALSSGVAATAVFVGLLTAVDALHTENSAAMTAPPSKEAMLGQVRGGRIIARKVYRHCAHPPTSAFPILAVRNG